jgi:hypothetical protein
MTTEQVLRSPNPNCPACAARRLHVAEEWMKFHTEAGTGFRATPASLRKEPTAVASRPSSKLPRCGMTSLVPTHSQRVIDQCR